MQLRNSNERIHLLQRTTNVAQRQDGIRVGEVVDEEEQLGTEQQQQPAATVFYNVGEPMQGQDLERPFVFRDEQATVLETNNGTDINLIYQFQTPLPQEQLRQSAQDANKRITEIVVDVPEDKGKDKKRKKKEEEEKRKRIQKQLQQQRMEVKLQRKKATFAPRETAYGCEEGEEEEQEEEEEEEENEESGNRYAARSQFQPPDRRIPATVTSQQQSGPPPMWMPQQPQQWMPHQHHQPAAGQPPHFGTWQQATMMPQQQQMGGWIW